MPLEAPRSGRRTGLEVRQAELMMCARCAAERPLRGLL